jgi:hypothetical protein
MYYATTAQYISYFMDFFQQQKNNAVNSLREWLGPPPQNFWLLDDGRVLPATYKLPHPVCNFAYLYDCETQQILGHSSAHGRLRRASPYLSVVVMQPDQEALDLSDWINELKVSPTPAMPFSLPQLIELWAAVHHKYVSTRYTIQYINSDGIPGSLIIA